MFCIILYLITAICYYLVFFKAREEHYEYIDNSYNREWVDKGKAKYPIWLWILAGIIALIPILGILVMVFVVIWFILGVGDTCDRERYKLNGSFLSFLNKKY